MIIVFSRLRCPFLSSHASSFSKSIPTAFFLLLLLLQLYKLHLWEWPHRNSPLIYSDFQPWPPSINIVHYPPGQPHSEAEAGAINIIIYFIDFTPGWAQMAGQHGQLLTVRSELIMGPEHVTIKTGPLRKPTSPSSFYKSLQFHPSLLYAMSRKQKLFSVPPKRRKKRVSTVRAKDGFHEGGYECRIMRKWKVLRIGKRIQKEGGNSDSGGCETGIYMFAAASLF